MMRSGMRTRFAPSPTGPLHLGHGYSALCVWQAAGRNPDNFLLRIDDLDHNRCRPEFVQPIIDDLHWLGIGWTEAPVYQQPRQPRYGAALDQLRAADLVYPCWLTRAELNSLLSAPHGQDHPVPPRRQLLASQSPPPVKQSGQEQSGQEQSGQAPAWRLDMEAALNRAGPVIWQELRAGQDGWQSHDGTDQLRQLGDIVLGRRDLAGSYHLSVVLDDADSAVELVMRGQDLRDFAPLHRLLQKLLGLAETRFAHHLLVCDETGKRLAKRDQARALAGYRADGLTPAGLAGMMPPLPDFRLPAG